MQMMNWDDGLPSTGDKSQAQETPSLASGRLRTRSPVAAKMALQTAGRSGGVTSDVGFASGVNGNTGATIEFAAAKMGKINEPGTGRVDILATKASGRLGSVAAK